MTLTEEIKKVALSNNIDYVGVAPVERFKYAPKGHKPTDLLPGAESVISIGIRISAGPELTQRIALADQTSRKLRHIAFSYRWFGYGLLNTYFLDRAAFVVTQLLDKQAEVALAIPASSMDVDIANTELMGELSNRHAAVAAGLGEFGWNQLCLTPDVGPRARFTSVITTAKLEPDPMYHGPRLCDPEKCKELGNGLPVCVSVCPIHNFSHKKTVKCIIGDREFEYAWHNHWRCGTASSSSHPNVLGPLDLVIPKRASVAMTRKLVSANTPKKNVLESLVFRRGHFCGMCLIRCPVGTHKPVEDIMKERESISQ